MNTLQAKEGKWLFNGETFVHKVSGFGDLSAWQEVDDAYKAQWDADHPIDNPMIDEQN